MGTANMPSKTLSKYSIFVTYVSYPEKTTLYLRYLETFDEIMVSAQQPCENITKSALFLSYETSCYILDTL